MHVSVFRLAEADINYDMALIGLSRLYSAHRCIVVSTLHSYRQQAHRTLTVNVAILYEAVDVGPAGEKLHNNSIVGFQICLSPAGECYTGYDTLILSTADSEAAGPPTLIELLWHESLAVANRL